MKSVINTGMIRRTLYILITIFSAVLTGIVTNDVAIKGISEASLNSLNVLAEMMSQTLKSDLIAMNYGLTKMADTPAFTELEPTGMTFEIATYNYYYYGLYNNMFVIDKDYQVIYGINDADAKGILYKVHIDKALEGERAHYYTSNTNPPFIQIAYPIQKEDEIVGAVVGTVDTGFIDKRLAAVQEIDSSIRAMVVDAQGRVIGDSKYIQTDNRLYNIDLEEVKQSIDYDPYLDFEGIDGTDVYGVYKELDSVEWVLILTKENGVGQIWDKIGYVIGLLSATTITAAEVMRKRLNDNNQVYTNKKNKKSNKDNEKEEKQQINKST